MKKYIRSAEGLTSRERQKIAKNSTDYEYYESLMPVDSAQDIDNTITIHYKRSFPGFSLNPFTIDYGDFVKQFATVKGDPAKDDYGLFVRWANISGVEYMLAYFSDDLDACIAEAKKWLDTNEPSDWMSARHFFINIIDTYSGEELYYADAWEDGSESWAYNI